MTGAVIALAGHVTAKAVAIGVVLVLAVVVELVACVGVLAMPTLEDRLHFVAPASAVGPVLVAVAMVAEESLDHQGIVAVVIAVFLVVFGPVISHATARANRVRAFGTWQERPGVDRVRRP